MQVQPKVVEYLILKTLRQGDLRVAVNEHIKEGWQPINGARTVSRTDTHSEGWIQTMVKYEEYKP